MRKYTFVICSFLAAAVAAQIVPGLNESRYTDSPVSSGGAYPPPTNDRVVLAPYAANSHGYYWDVDRYYAEEWDDVNKTFVQVWPPAWGFVNTQHVGFRYTGYIYIGEGSNNVTFCCAFTAGKRLYIDENVIYHIPLDDYNALPVATVQLATGWHSIDMIFDDNGINGWGVEWRKEWAGRGFGVDWQGRGSPNWYDYEFPIDPGDGSLFSATRPPFQINFSPSTVTGVNSNSTVANITLSLDPADSGTLWLFCREGADPGPTTNGWDFALEWPAPLAHPDFDPLTYAFALTNLAPGASYTFRAAFVSDNGGFAISSAPPPFTTRPFDTPAAFSFRPQAPWEDPWLRGTTWHAPGEWTNLDGGARETPGVPGDTVQSFPDIYEPTIRPAVATTLTNDATVGGIIAGNYAGDNAWWEFFDIYANTSANPVTLTLDAGATADRAFIEAAVSKRLTVGWPNNSPGFKLNLARPLHIRKTHWGHTDIAIGAAITGGSEGAPSHITIDKSAGWGIFRVAFYSHDNDFTGDIILRNTGEWDRCNFHIGAWIGEQIQAWAPPSDALMGNPANRIILTGPNCHLQIQEADQFTLKRTLIGTGLVSASQMPNTTDEELWDKVWDPVEHWRPRRRTFTLGDGAVLSPGFDAAVAEHGLAPALGTLVIRASDMVMDAGTRVRVKITPEQDVCDQLEIYLGNSSNYLTGIHIAGTLEVSQLDPGAFVRSGTSWTFMRFPDPTPFTGAFKRPTGYAVDYITDGAGDLESVTLTKLPHATTVIVR